MGPGALPTPRIRAGQVADRWWRSWIGDRHIVVVVGSKKSNIVGLIGHREQGEKDRKFE